MERIDFKLTKSETERPKDVIEAYIGLHEDYIQYKVDYYLDENDEALGWVFDKYVYFDECANKETVKGVRISYKHSTEKWCVTVHLNGFQEDIWVLFYEEEKAKSLFDKIMKWKYNK